MAAAAAAAAVKALWEEVRELSLGTTPAIDELESPPPPLNFLRDYVAANKPCLIRGGAAHWPAVRLWSNPSYLVNAAGPDRLVSVHLTPDGRADALAAHPAGPGRCFAAAAVRKLPFAAALRLVSAASSPIAYLQEQNDCLRSPEEFGGSKLGGDVAAELTWATAALGGAPEAVNLWIGNSLSETSFHKDHYENLYAVVAGEKEFLLLPPTDVHRLYVRRYPAAGYVADGDSLRLELEEPPRMVPWCSVEPDPGSGAVRSAAPLYFDGPPPFGCTVRPGDILYLPSMWFHHVRQTADESSGLAIAVNYWYDMQFDIKYAYFNLLQSIEFPPANEEEEEDEEERDGPPPLVAEQEEAAD